MKPLVFAHRGYSQRYPENTAIAFTKAFEFNADGIECDVQKTKDGKFIIIHDESLDRTTTLKGKLSELNWDLIKTANAGQGEKILTLHALLSDYPKKSWINIELKKETITNADLPAIQDEILNSLTKEKVVISSFEHSLLPYFKKNGFKIGALIGEEHQKLGIFHLIKSLFKLAPYSVHLPIQIFEVLPNWLAKFIFLIFIWFRKKLYFWTVDDLNLAKSLLPFASAFITNDPKSICEFLDIQK